MSDNSRVRVSIVGVVIVALFSALLARLWFLQMGAEEELAVPGGRAQHAHDPDRVAAWRASSTATATCSSRTSREWAVTVDRTLDKDDARAGHRSARRGARTAVHGRAARSRTSTTCASRRSSRRSSRSTCPNRPGSRSSSTSRTIRARRSQKLTVRHYPQGQLAAQVLGYVGEISDEQLATRRDDGYQEGETIGKDGVERAFENGPARRAAARDGRGRPDRSAGRRAARRRPGHGRRRRRAHDRRELAGARPSSRSRRASSPRASSRTRTSRTSASRS